MWCLSVDSNINPTLRLSYHVLPSNLKRCFAYCSMFPKGYEFEKNELINFWMAEGLLKCCEKGKSEEELGDEFFNQLEYISFFQQSEDNFFVMHDLVNDLAKSVSGEFCLRLEGDLIPRLLDREQDIPDKTRHIWCSNDEDKILEHIYKCNGLRTLIWNGGDRGFKICNNAQHALFSRLKYLLVLSFEFHDISELDDGISNLKLLRYLDLSYTEIKRLPDSICMLHNLQTLKLEDCRNLTELPSDFYKLVNLRHLHLKGSPIKKMPKDIGRLIHLRTLTDFVVGEHSGSDIKELAKLNHLQGTLKISGLGNITDTADAIEANLKNKKHLEELLLNFDGRTERRLTSGENRDAIIERRVLEALQPDCNLNRPKLIASREEWGLSRLHSLKQFTVSDDFENVESFPEENLLPPNINHLILQYCSKLRIINKRGLLHLKSLKSLSIWFCPCLEYLPEEGLPNSLSSFWILKCPLLQQRYQKEEGERWHKISHIPRVSIE